MKHAGMSPAVAREFQKSIRAGLNKTAEDKYREAVAKIDQEIVAQRSECSQEHGQILERLQREVSDHAQKLAEARAAKKKAAEIAAAEREKLTIANKLKTAEGAQKARKCVVEAEGIKAKRAALKAHHAELKQIARSTERRKKPKSSASERKSEQRGAVEGNLDPSRVPLWRQVARTFKVPAKTEGRQSLEEAFNHWADENPDAVQAAQEAEGEAEIKRLSRGRPRKPAPGQKKLRMSKMLAEEARELDEQLARDGVPF